MTVQRREQLLSQAELLNKTMQGSKINQVDGTDIKVFIFTRCGLQS